MFLTLFGIGIFCIEARYPKQGVAYYGPGRVQGIAREMQ